MSVLCASLVVVRGALAGQQLTPTERATAVATIWAEARYNFAYWDRVRADWDSALGANLKLAAERQADRTLHRRTPAPITARMRSTACNTAARPPALGCGPGPVRRHSTTVDSHP